MRSHIHLRDHHREGQIFSNRLVAAIILVVLMTLILIGRMVWLQWAQYERFAILSEENRLQTQALAPPRGLIVDRRGAVLADNRPDFSLTVVPEQVKDIDATLAKISELIELNDEDVDRFLKIVRSRRRPWDPVPLRGRMNDEDLALIASSLHELPGVRISAEAIRRYPYDDLFSHVLGYVNRINVDDQARMDEASVANYAGTHFYGRTGVERYYENMLHGQVGYRKVETNARGRVLQVVEEQPPIPGTDLHLFLDLRTQKAAWDALGNRRGAVVAIDPRDGGVLAFVSRPGFNPNLFVTGISHKDYSGYREDHDRPLFNRALQGQYPPGSTLKPLIGLAGLQYDATNWSRTIRDPGIFKLPDTKRTYRDWKRGGHGIVDLHTAIVQSCDVYFYDTGVKLGIDNYHEFLDKFSLGRLTGIDIPGEVSGNLPSREWKRGARREAWFHGDTVNASIGQGYVLATPVQLALSTAMIARNGVHLTPRVALENNVIVPGMDVNLKHPNDWARMHSAMEDVIHGARGTARVVGYGSKYRVAGKTGTAQVFSVAEDEEYDESEISERLRDHALFIAYAPADNPAIAIAVLVENGSHGGSTAGPVARAVMDAWLLNKNGELDVPPPLAETVQAQNTATSETPKKSADAGSPTP
ncbi:MAG: penicillin-binding protein 2 [Alcanivoracaceae bacterium]|nr:penicillin-binding protein 2 [Alcanivoracaceae bacterium]